MSKKPKWLYAVSVETEMVVLASGPEEAREIARDNVGEVDWYDCVGLVYPMSSLPAGYDGSELPYGSDPDRPEARTIRELIDQGAAPAYIQRKKRLESLAKQRLPGEPGDGT